MLGATAAFECTAGTRLNRVSALLLLPLLAGVGACARNPVSGRPEVMLVSEAKERELGEAEAKRVAETMGLVDDPKLAAYVRAIGDRLARFSPRAIPYTFNVVDTEEPNAFALPGGPVYVSCGLLVLTNTEDELAGVLGHEIAHVAARHAVRRVTRAAPLGILTGLGATVTGIVSPALGDLVGGVGGLAGSLVLAPYSRGQEREADRVGQEMAARAGWDPAGISGALRGLEREEALRGNQRRAMDFFATHPSLPDRVAETETRARELSRGPAAPIAAGRAAFLRRLEGLAVGPRAADGLFEGENFLHPDLDFRIRFPPGWKTANGRSVVGASAPDGRALVGLEMVGNGSDPEAALRALEKETKTDLASQSERLTIAGRPAVHTTTRAATRDGQVALDLTWIAHGGRIFCIAGATAPRDAAALQAVFRDTAGSFRPLTAGERAGIQQTRLRTVAGRANETLPRLAARTSSTWNADMVAVANGLDAGVALQAGQLLKVAVSEPYVGR